MGRVEGMRVMKVEGNMGGRQGNSKIEGVSRFVRGQMCTVKLARGRESQRNIQKNNGSWTWIYSHAPMLWIICVVHGDESAARERCLGHKFHRNISELGGNVM